MNPRLSPLLLILSLLGPALAGCEFFLENEGGGGGSSYFVEFSVFDHPADGDYSYTTEVACEYFAAEDYFGIQACASSGCDEGLHGSDMWNTIGVGTYGVGDLEALHGQPADLVWFADDWGTLGPGSCLVTVEDTEFESTGTFDCDWGVTYSEVDEDGELGPAQGDVVVEGSFVCP